MVKASPYLRQHITVHKDKIFLKWDQASKYVPLGRDSDTMDGLNVHCAIVDETRAPHVGDLGRARDGHGRPDAGAHVRDYDGRLQPVVILLRAAQVHVAGVGWCDRG